MRFNNFSVCVCVSFFSRRVANETGKEKKARSKRNCKPSRKTLQIAEQLVKRSIKMNQLHIVWKREREKKYCSLFYVFSSHSLIRWIKKIRWIFRKERSFIFRLYTCVCVRAQGVAIINFDEIYKLYQKPFLQGNQTRDEIRSNLWVVWSVCAPVVAKKNKNLIFFSEIEFKWQTSHGMNEKDMPISFVVGGYGQNWLGHSIQWSKLGLNSAHSLQWTFFFASSIIRKYNLCENQFDYHFFKENWKWMNTRSGNRFFRHVCG